MLSITQKDITRAFGIFIFSAAFVYDIIWNGNDFGWDNAGIFAVVILGDTGIIKLAEVVRGSILSKVSTSNTGGDDSSGNPDSSDTDLPARQKPVRTTAPSKSGKAKR